MRSAPAAVAFAAALAIAAPAPSAHAADPHRCDEAMKWCVGAFIKHDRRFLDVAILGGTGRYRVCVTPPQAKERCKSFTLVPIVTGAGTSSVAFTNHFPHARRGRYAVRWLYGGKQVGPVLRFRHPA